MCVCWWGGGGGMVPTLPPKTFSNLVLHVPRSLVHSLQEPEQGRQREDRGRSWVCTRLTFSHCSCKYSKAIPDMDVCGFEIGQRCRD